MGFFDKIKDLFTDEIEGTEPIKKEVIKVEIASPKKEEEETNVTISDSTIVNKPEKHQTPVFFSDSDFEDLRYTGFNKDKEKEKTKNLYNNDKPIKEEKKFKPSPIISPVYGILDKNYSKDDISVKKVEKTTITFTSSIDSKKVDIDSVRKKAFGTLEEELENEILSTNSILFKDDLEEEPVEKDLFEELKHKETKTSYTINDSAEKIEESNTDLFEDLPFDDDITITETQTIDVGIEDKMVVDELERMFESEDKLTESDLFDLIDSMYEKGEDNDESME